MSSSDPKQIQDKLKELELLQKKLDWQEGLPHLYGLPFYPWAEDFFNSTNRYNFLCAANQIGKSSTQIRKCIHWATETDIWPKLWPRRPFQFWYLYPNKSTATIEITKKWIEEFLPRGKFKDHPKYGWKLEIKNKEVFAIHFNTGVSIYPKTYGQELTDLQAGSCHAIFCDEELPAELYPELNMRMAATRGHFHMVFTATLGQDFWRETIEVKGKGERFPDAFKRQISMYDCLRYVDGSPSPWTVEEITRLKNSCGTNNEVLRRIYGRFVVSEGLKYPAFDRFRNVRIPSMPVPAHWLKYAGIDPGGGGTSHPAAISFIAVRPDFKEARIFKGWRGDDVTTTAGDVLAKYLELKGDMHITEARFDWADKDFGVIAHRMGIPVIPANKSHEQGEQILNVLFKNTILTIDDTEELKPLVHEFTTLQSNTAKNKAKDDYIDSVRYPAVTIPWDYSDIQGLIELGSPPPPQPDPLDRRRVYEFSQESVFQGIEEELQSWNDLYE